MKSLFGSIALVLVLFVMGCTAEEANGQALVIDAEVTGEIIGPESDRFDDVNVRVISDPNVSYSVVATQLKFVLMMGPFGPYPKIVEKDIYLSWSTGTDQWVTGPLLFRVPPAERDGDWDGGHVYAIRWRVTDGGGTVYDEAYSSWTAQ